MSAPGSIGPTRESFEGRGDEARQRVQVVAALEHGGESRRQRRSSPGQLPESGRRQPHAGKGVLFVRVEARGDDHELRIEPLERRGDGVIEGAQVLLVARAR
jgi:hypothetical protein